jgi:hypothetical protein
MPRGIQRRRTKGWVLPEGAVIVDRTSRYGNPFRIGAPFPEEMRARVAEYYQPPSADPMDRETAVFLFGLYMEDRLRREPGWLEPLRGATALACTCKTTVPCHRDALCEWVMRHPLTVTADTRPVFGVHVMAGDEAYGALAWPSPGEYSGARTARWRRRLRGVPDDAPDE